MKYFISNIFLLMLFVIISGCNNDLAKSVDKTDQKVYKLIDDAWDDNVFDDAGDYSISNETINVDDSVLLNLSSKKQLTLPQAVAIATAYNRGYAVERENLYLAALDQVNVEHLYETMFFAGVNAGQRKDGADKGAGAFGNAGFSQLLATGASIGSNISIGWLDILSGDMKSGMSAIASAVISQPLLRGAGRKVALENLTQAQRNTLYQIRDFNRYRKEFITYVISAYFEVLISHERYINSQEHYNRLLGTYAKLEKRSSVGKVSKHQFDQIKQDLLESKSICLKREQEYSAIADRFKMTMAIAPDDVVMLDPNELEVLILSISDEIPITEAHAIEIALDQRLDLVNASDKVVDAARKVDVAADAIRAELNLVGYVQSDINNNSRGFFGANPAQLNTSQNQYELSLQLDLPLDRVAEKNAYRRSLIHLVRQQRIHQEKTDNVISEIRSAHRRMKESQVRYKFERQSCNVAEKRAKNALLLLQFDRASTRDLLDAYDDLFESKDAESESLRDYISASLDLYRDTGIIKILPDGKWENQIPQDLKVSKAN